MTALVEPPSRMRRAVLRTVTASAAIPQFHLEYDLDCAGLSAAREVWRERGRAEVSVADLIHLATVRTLAHHPLLNASFTDEGIRFHEAVNLAFIVAVADGMVTPTIPGADALGLPELTDARRRLTTGALRGGLRPDDVLNGTFTVSNLGPLGIPRFNAMVLPPQAAVLAVGAARAGILTLTLTVDHRVVDGAPAARFLADLGGRLADPQWLSAAGAREDSTIATAHGGPAA